MDDIKNTAPIWNSENIKKWKTNLKGEKTILYHEVLSDIESSCELDVTANIYLMKEVINFVDEPYDSFRAKLFVLSKELITFINFAKKIDGTF
jgi:hypothetical protein